MNFPFFQQANIKGTIRLPSKLRLRSLLFIGAILIVTIAACTTDSPPSPPAPTQAAATLAPPTSTTAPQATLAPTQIPEGWSLLETTNSPGPRAGHTMVMLNDGRILLFGGRNEEGFLGDTWVFTPDSLSQGRPSSGPGLLRPSTRPRHDWNQLNPANSPEARSGSTMVILPDGSVMLFGGENDVGDMFNDLRIFNNNEWNQINPGNDPPPARSQHAAWTYENKLYVQGGIGQGTLHEDLWVYDMFSNTWLNLSNPPGFISPNAYPALYEDKGYVYFVDPHRGDMLYIYDILDDLWAQQQLTGEQPQGAPYNMAWAQGGNKVYMMGGQKWDADAGESKPSSES